MNILSTLTGYFNVALAICFIVSAVFAARKGFFKDNAAVQDQTINALKVRVETLEGESASDKREIARLTDELRKSKQLMSAVRHALARRGLIIETDDEYVTLIDAEGQRTTQIKRPVKLVPIENDDAV